MLFILFNIRVANVSGAFLFIIIKVRASYKSFPSRREVA
jgi:hypothetical protein